MSERNQTGISCRMAFPFGRFWCFRSNSNTAWHGGHPASTGERVSQIVPQAAHNGRRNSTDRIKRNYAFSPGVLHWERMEFSRFSPVRMFACSGLLCAGAKQFLSSARKRPAAGSQNSGPNLLLCWIAFGVCGTASATSLYWDGNGTTAGAGAAPTGTWGTDSFWNSDSTGGGGGSFTATTASTDDLFFSAGNTTALSGTSPYTVTVNGTVSANKLTFQSIGAATLSGGTINLGGGGISSPRTIITNGDRQVATINSAIVLTATQAWLTDGTNGTKSLLINGAISGTGNLTLTQTANREFTLSNSVNHVGSITANGSNANGNVTISGNIGTSVTGVSATGSALLTLTGTNTYTGATNVTTSGRLAVGVAGVGSLTSAINVSSGTLSGSGSTTGAVTIGNGAGASDSFIASGNGSTGTFTTTGSLSLLSDATYQFELRSNTLAADRIVANGVSLNSSSVFSFTDLGSSAIALNTIFLAIDNTSGFAIVGTFSGLAEGATFTSGLNRYQASYVGGVGGNDFTLTVVPEPSTFVLLAVGLGIVLILRRRARASI